MISGLTPLVEREFLILQLAGILVFSFLSDKHSLLPVTLQNSPCLPHN